MRALSPGPAPMLLRLLLLLLLGCLQSVHCAFVTFDNCLPDSITNPRPKQLQFTPLFVNASFLPIRSSHVLNLTIYGNVSGSQFQGPYPPPDSPKWRDDNITYGKIADTGADGSKLTTLTSNYMVLTYTAYDNPGREFCDSTVNNTTCPIGPAFDGNASDPATLPAFSLSHDFGSSYAFSTISSTIHVISGDQNAADVACISAQITPDLGPSISNLLTWLPAAILILKGLATLTAAIWSPWGSLDIFRWSSNYGRDEDLLRLVTPGFGDCLQYIQFIVLTGSLTLQYPGFYQPAVSQSAWSSLLFNESFVSGGTGTQSLIDGLYATNGTYGLTKMSQLIGMSRGEDIWACMAVWLLVIAAAVVLLCQLGFLGRWLFRLVTKTSEEDLRSKNLPFTLGNIVRLLFNYFILPIVALSLFQLVISPRSPSSVIACAVVLLVIMIAWAGWILHVIFTTKPRTLLFDDMPTVLHYGPVYNTYNDNAAPFALIPVAITFMRGVAIGAVQPSGIAQIIILAICEVILILTLNAFRPFQGQTSMNLYHTFFAAVRLTTILLMISFVPSLGVTEAPKGWIGYVILLLHACVLVFGFFLNAAQTMIEVLARSLGAGGDPQHGAVRGSILNWRMLKKRQNRSGHAHRDSMMSSAAILRDGNENSGTYGGRSRSISASSQALLNRMSGFENFSSAGGEILNSPDPDSSAGLGSMTGAAGKTSIGAKVEGENYYRPPRQRKATLDAMSAPGIKTRSTGDFPYQDSPNQPGVHARDASYDSTLHGSPAPAPAYFRGRQESGEHRESPRTDYAVREVDQYYRGPALNDQPSRKLGTGPADPVGPASTAQSWFQRLMIGMMGGKNKDQTKGFEVVRSSRMQPGMQKEGGAANEALELQQSPPMHQEAYRDSPETSQGDSQAEAGASRSFDRSLSPTDIAQQPAAEEFHFGFDGRNDTSNAYVRPDSDTIGQLGTPVLEPISTEHRASMGLPPAISLALPSQDTANDRQTDRESSHYPESEHNFRYSDQPVPSLDPIDSFGGLDLPSRWNSNAGSHAPSRFNSNAGNTEQRPAIPQMPSSRSNVNPDIGNTIGGQEWLRAVDNLEWNHGNQPALSTQTSQQSFRHPPPSVPRRSSRRTVSQEQAAARYQPEGDNIFEGFDSDGLSPDWLSSPAEDNHNPPAQSNHTHQVSHHRAADSITRNSFGASAAMQGSSAEFFGQTPPQNHNDDFLQDR